MSNHNVVFHAFFLDELIDELDELIDELELELELKELLELDEDK